MGAAKDAQLAFRDECVVQTLPSGGHAQDASINSVRPSARHDPGSPRMDAMAPACSPKRCVSLVAALWVSSEPGRILDYGTEVMHKARASVTMHAAGNDALIAPC